MKFNFELIIILFLSSALFYGCGKKEETKKEEHHEDEHSEIINLSEAAIKHIKLQTEPAAFKLLTGLMAITAKVIVNQDNEAQVGSLVQGRVNKVFVKVGEYVKAGQELMQVEGMEIGEIKAEFLSAKANLEYLKSNYERQKKLMEQKVGSQKSLLEAQAEYEKALAGYNAEDKKIHSIGLTDDDIINDRNNQGEHTAGTLPVKAPISGVIVERNVVIGQSVDGTSNAFRIINTSSVWVDGQIYEKDLNKINDKKEIYFITSTYPGEKFTGRIIYIGQVIDEESRTITVRAEFNNQNGNLKPQMFGELHLPVGNNSTAILIPAESVVKIGNENFVFVQKGGTQFERRRVITGAEQNNLIEIKEGLKEKENVTIKGAFYLKSEMMKDELEEHEH